MDCRETENVLSAAHDDFPVAPEELRAAKSHCAKCPECTAFTEALVRLHALSAVQPPLDLADRIVEAVRAKAAPASETVEAAPVVPIAPRARRVPSGAWIAAGSLVAAAAVLFLAVGIVGGLFGGGAKTGQPAAVDTATTAGSSAANKAAESRGLGAQPAAPAPTQRQSIVPPAAAPAYLVFEGRVYHPGALLSTSTAAPVSIGTALTAFDTGGGPSSVQVSRSPLADGSVVVAAPGGPQLYTPITRTYNGTVYQLVSGTPIPNFGVWPRLPVSYPEPTSASGSPTFAQTGQDALGAAVYTPGGAPVTTGFAIGPNSASTDPAAANPNWTWWEPLVKP